MKRTLFLILFLVPAVIWAESQIFFRIAINESGYNTFLTEKYRAKQTKQQLMAMMLENPYFHPENLNRKFYKINIVKGVKYRNRIVTQYEIVPRFNDRFRHVVLIDDIDQIALQREMFDLKGKLIYAYGHVNYTPKKENNKARPPRPVEKVLGEEYKGFKPVYKNTLKDGSRQTLYTDGINRFSFFEKDIKKDIPTVERIINGNYFYRKQFGDVLYTVVGTVPFTMMNQIIDDFHKDRR